mmetsp:Transcript_5341/g.12380  ORF Transcript_5341/g.12380 Transcript_5341/m.12380 type:complete len:200 (+) Transcript_5341:269-868(+)
MLNFLAAEEIYTWPRRACLWSPSGPWNGAISSCRCPEESARADCLKKVRGLLVMTMTSLRSALLMMMHPPTQPPRRNCTSFDVALLPDDADCSKPTPAILTIQQRRTAPEEKLGAAGALSDLDQCHPKEALRPPLADAVICACSALLMQLFAESILVEYLTSSFDSKRWCGWSFESQKQQMSITLMLITWSGLEDAHSS